VASVVWLPEALADIERLYGFLFDTNPTAAKNAVVCIRAAAHRLEQFPEIGRRMDDDTERREVFTAFGAGAYVLRYRVDSTGTAVVIRVWHSREARE